MSTRCEEKKHHRSKSGGKKVNQMKRKFEMSVNISKLVSKTAAQQCEFCAREGPRRRGHRFYRKTSVKICSELGTLEQNTEQTVSHDQASIVNQMAAEVEQTLVLQKTNTVQKPNDNSINAGLTAGILSNIMMIR